MLLLEKTREYPFPSAEQVHLLYISVYSADCLLIPCLATWKDSLALCPA